MQMAADQHCPRQSPFACRVLQTEGAQPTAASSAAQASLRCRRSCGAGVVAVLFPQRVRALIGTARELLADVATGMAAGHAATAIKLYFL